MRRRITLLAAVTSMLAVLVLAVPLGVFAARGYVNDERVELQRTASSVAAALRTDGPRVPALRRQGSEVSVGIYDRAGHLVNGAGPTLGGSVVLAAARGTESTTTTAGQLVVAAPVSDGDQVVFVVVLRSDLSAARHRSMTAWLVIAAIGTGAVLVAALAAQVLARRLAVPIEHTRLAAHRIGAGDLDARVPSLGIAELDVLGDALNDAAARIHAMIGREQRLSAEISHQLRTPLTGLRLELETLAESYPGEPRIGALLVSVDALSDTITDVIALARDVPAARTTETTTLLHDLDRRWRGLLAAATRPLRVVADVDLPDIALSPAAAAQILDVLVDNARNHGAGAITVRARAEGGVVVVEVSDQGPALQTEAHELFAAREPGRTDGIGLPFARRVAEAEQARVTLSSISPPTFSLIARAVSSPPQKSSPRQKSSPPQSSSPAQNSKRSS